MILFSARHPARDILAHAIRDRVAAGGHKGVAALRAVLRRHALEVELVRTR